MFVVCVLKDMISLRILQPVFQFVVLLIVSNVLKVIKTNALFAILHLIYKMEPVLELVFLVVQDVWMEAVFITGLLRLDNVLNVHQHLLFIQEFAILKHVIFMDVHFALHGQLLLQ